MKRKLVLVFAGIIFACKFCLGQVALPDSIWQAEFLFRVKQMDEFMARFNGEESIKIDVADSLKPQVNLLYLFNRDLFATNRDSMQNIVETFISRVLESKTKLYYEDGDWLAEVGCNCIYKGQNDTLTLYLKPEKNEEFNYRWVIVGAKGKVLRLLPPKRNRGLEILPNNHEIAFRALSKISSLGSNNILNYAERDYEPNELSSFYALVYADALKIENTGKITYYFFEIPGYTFTVDRFNRKGTNVGWLISNLMLMNEEEKQIYYDHLFKE